VYDVCFSAVSLRSGRLQRSCPSEHYSKCLNAASGSQQSQRAGELLVLASRNALPVCMMCVCFSAVSLLSGRLQRSCPSEHYCKCLNTASGSQQSQRTGELLVLTSRNALPVCMMCVCFSAVSLLSSRLHRSCPSEHYNKC
jgi:hypothetical protein